MMAGTPDIVRAGTHGESCLGSNHYLMPAPSDRFAQNLLRHAGRVNVGGVEQVYARRKTNVHQTGGFRNVR